MPKAPGNFRPAWVSRFKRSRNIRRGSSAARGYGRRWRKYRLWFLSVNPWCAHCDREGRTVAATEVDHITPVHGPDDPLFWDTDNHQALCKPCHARKTMKEGALQT